MIVDSRGMIVDSLIVECCFSGHQLSTMLHQLRCILPALHEADELHRALLSQPTKPKLSTASAGACSGCPCCFYLAGFR